MLIISQLVGPIMFFSSYKLAFSSASQNFADCIICVYRSFLKCSVIYILIVLNCLSRTQEVCRRCNLNILFHVTIFDLFEELLDGHVLLGVLKHNLGHGHLEILLGHMDSPLSQCVHTLKIDEITYLVLFTFLS